MSFHDPYGRPMFGALMPAGRKITAGFTYLQRIGKAASFDVWFPDALRETVQAHLAAGRHLDSTRFPAHWAAVRQFELLQESGNHKVYDLDPQDLQRATLDLARSMRAGGLRVTVATLGSYDDMSAGDDLELLDSRLQERIAQMIHMLYLDAASEEASEQSAVKLAENRWDYRDQLPHVGMVLGAAALFDRIPADAAEEQPARRRGKKGGTDSLSVAKRHRLARQFFNILSHLPQNHIAHDTAIGLQLPELNGDNHWNYIAHPEDTLDAFNRVLNALFDPFNRLSLARLHGNADAPAEIKASTLHLRGYGHPLGEAANRFYRNAALSLH